MIIKFGKYKGIDSRSVCETDPSYIEWLIRNSREKADDPQWGQKNVETADELEKELNAVRSGGLPSIQTPSNASIEDKLTALDTRINKLADEVAVLSWHLNGQKKVDNPKDLTWEE